MKKMLICLLLACSAALFTGCATGPKFHDVKASFPVLAPENGRVYFYRTAVMGAALQPAVKLNGQEVGKSQAKGFFFVDRLPGNYEVETSTEVKRSLSLTLDKGQTRYVRFNVSMGFLVGHVYPELIENETGEKEITKCSYIGEK